MSKWLYKHRMFAVVKLEVSYRLLSIYSYAKIKNTFICN